MYDADDEKVVKALGASAQRSNTRTEDDDSTSSTAGPANRDRNKTARTINEIPRAFNPTNQRFAAPSRPQVSKRRSSPGGCDLADHTKGRPSKKKRTRVNINPAPAPTVISRCPQYLGGAVKRTWALGFDRENDVKIEDVLQKDGLTHLLISTSDLDPEWLASKVKKDTVQTWVLGYPNEEEGKQARKIGAPNNGDVSIRPINTGSYAEELGPGGSYHANFLICSHLEYTRIAITSANLTKRDWGETGEMENILFLIDLPILPNGRRTTFQELTPFGQELYVYVRNVVNTDIFKKYLRFDWSHTKHLAFVHSLRDNHTNPNSRPVGLVGLSNAIQMLNLQTTTLELDYATSLLGQLNIEFMEDLFAASRGEKMKAWAKARLKKGKRMRKFDMKDCFRVYFPTRDTVAKSNGGPEDTSTIALPRDCLNAEAFPTMCMRDYKSTRGGLGSHSKIILGRGYRLESDNSGTNKRKSVAWAYIGSTDLNESGWGDLISGDESYSVKCRNYECGVIVSVDAEQLGENGQGCGMPDYSVFEGTLDIPFEIPGNKYDGQEPWCTG